MCWHAAWAAVPLVGEHQWQTDQHEAILGDLRFGETFDAVVAHAVSELDFDVERRFLLGGQIEGHTGADRSTWRGGLRRRRL